MFRKALLLMAMLVGSAAQAMTTVAATLFNPTSSDVNVAILTPLLGSPPATWQIGLFDDDIVSGGIPDFTGASYLSLDPAGDRAIFSGNDVTSGTGNGPFSLTGGQTFLLALDTGSGWAAPDAVSCNGAALGCALSWSGTAIGLVADVIPVPLPTTMPLFIGALFALGLLRRRRSPSERI